MNLLNLLVKIGVDDEASRRISGIADRAKGAFGGIAKAAGVVSAAVSAVAGSAVVAVGKAAFDAYANYEQLAGGVEKLYGESADKIKRYAQEGYKTSGMSANQYMEQATSFSASLINSLGGDTARAADQTDKAMRLMSDNVNVFGSNAEDVQNAIKGISRENYTMLDNLKLGYSGSKEGMQELIDDANEYAKSIGQAGDLQMGNFSDAIDAIELIQQKQGIAGTTAKEAATTIEGSINMTKAAWQNLLTEFGKDDGDVAARMTELIDSAMTAFDNIAPRVVTIFENIVESIPTFIDKVSPYMEQLSTKFQEFVSSHQGEIDAAAQVLWDGIIKALATCVQMSFAALGKLLGTLVQTFPSWAPQLLEAAVMLFVNIVQGITEVTVDVLNAIADVIGQAISAVVEYAAPMAEAAAEFVQGIPAAIETKAGEIVAAVQGFVSKAINAVTSKAASMVSAAGKFISGFVNGITSGASRAVTAAGNMITRVVNKIKELPGKITGALGNLGNLLANAGKQVIQGLIDGISSKIEEVKSKLSGLTKLIPSWKGPADVDKMLLYGNGQLIMDGLVRGIDSGIPGLRSELGDVTRLIGGTSADMGFTTKTAMANAYGGGDIYNVYLQIEDPNDYNAMAMAFTNAVETRNRMRGRESSIVTRMV